MPAQSHSRYWKNIEPLVAFLLVAGVLAITIPVVQAYGDRNRICAENIHALATAVNYYIQDYDEHYPPASVWNDTSRFKTAINPYAHSTAIFQCPATKSSYYARNSALAGQSRSSVDGDTVRMLQDSVVHPDGTTTVAFVDGHVERNGVEQFFPNANIACVQRVQGITLGLQQYAQDYDERLPFQTNDSQLRAVLYPYLKTNRFWNCPVTGTSYTIPQTIRGKSLSDFSDRSQVVTVRDGKVHKDGIITTAYLNGYAEQSGPNGTKIYPPGSDTPVSPDQLSVNRLKALGLALIQYTWDHNDILPPMTDMDTLRPLLMPYVQDSNVFSPPIAGGTPFVLNTSLSGKNINSLSVTTVIWIKDTNNYGPPLITAGYLDGHVVRIAP